MTNAFAANMLDLGGKACTRDLTGAVTEVPILRTAGGDSSPTDFTVSTYKSFVRTVSSQYLARVQSFSVRYNASAAEIGAAGKTVMSDAIAYDDPDTTSDLDYLKWNMDRYQYQVAGYKSSTSAYAIYTFSQTYRTTAKEEAFVNTEVADILKELDIGSAGRV